MRKDRLNFLHFQEFLLKIWLRDYDCVLVETPFYFYFSSFDERVTESLSMNLLKMPPFYVGGVQIGVTSVEVLPMPTFSNGTLIKMISPITVYSTLFKQDGTKKTYFYNPVEKEFSELIKSNAIKKYKLTKNEEYKGNFVFEVVRFSIKRNYHTKGW